MENEEAPNPVQQRLRDYREAFGNLAVSFAGEGQKAEAVPENEQLDKTEKMKLLWKNRLEENRAAVAIQLGEMAQVMTDTVEYAWDTRPDEELEQVLAKKLKGMGLWRPFSAGLSGGAPAAGGISDGQYPQAEMCGDEGYCRGIV